MLVTITYPDAGRDISENNKTSSDGKNYIFIERIFLGGKSENAYLTNLRAKKPLEALQAMRYSIFKREQV